MTQVTETERGSKTALGAYLIIPVLASSLTIYYVISTLDLVWEAKATGLFIGSILLALCAIQFARFGIQFFRGEASFGLGELAADTTFNRQRLLLLLLILAFIVTLHWVGTTLGLFIVLIACMWVLGVRKPHILIGVALTTALVVHVLLIRLVGSQLPQGILKNLTPFVGL